MMRSIAHVAQLVEHTLGKGEVGSSSLLMSSKCIDKLSCLHSAVMLLR